MPVFALLAIRLGFTGIYCRGLFLQMWSNDLKYQDTCARGTCAVDLGSIEAAMHAINDNVSGAKAEHVAKAVRKGRGK